SALVLLRGMTMSGEPPEAALARPAGERLAWAAGSKEARRSGPQASARVARFLPGTWPMETTRAAQQPYYRCSARPVPTRKKVLTARRSISPRRGYSPLTQGACRDHPPRTPSEARMDGPRYAESALALSRGREA